MSFTLDTIEDTNTDVKKLLAHIENALKAHLRSFIYEPSEELWVYIQPCKAIECIPIQIIITPKEENGTKLHTD
jgi:hypothetical protein